MSRHVYIFQFCFSFQIRPPQAKDGFFGGIFFDFCHGFLRYFQRVKRTSSPILLGRMQFSATNCILNFIFLRKVLQFCLFLLYFFLWTKTKLDVIKFFWGYFRVERTFRPNFGRPNAISGHQSYFEFHFFAEISSIFNYFFFLRTKIKPNVTKFYPMIL